MQGGGAASGTACPIDSGPSDDQGPLAAVLRASLGGTWGQGGATMGQTRNSGKEGGTPKHRVGQGRRGRSWDRVGALRGAWGTASYRVGTVPHRVGTVQPCVGLVQLCGRVPQARGR